jgi:hypothetical protein
MYKIYLRLGIICHYIVFFIKKGTSLNSISSSTPIYLISYITINVKLLSLSVLIISRKIQYIEIGKG